MPRAVIQSDLNLTLFALLTYDYPTADNSFRNATPTVTQSFPHQRPPPAGSAGCAHEYPSPPPDS